jgi:uncharacterized protein YcbK (DUF882 family)
MSKFKYFSAKELACQCGCGRGEEDMDEEFMHKVVELREACSFPLSVSSGFRCPDHNNNVSSTGLAGPHTTGKALDVKVVGDKAHKVLEAMFELGFPGVGVSQKGNHRTRFIHLDGLSGNGRPWVWSY